MTEFVRENRYVIFKSTDIQRYLTTEDKHLLLLLDNKISKGRCDDNRPQLNAVVVEEDWPEYEKVWQMIEDGVLGGSNERTR